jgi:hypothetical protein
VARRPNGKMQVLVLVMIAILSISRVAGTSSKIEDKIDS